MPSVLVVDDDDDVREITQIALEAIGGWNVLAASGGQEGFELALEHLPDAVLLDVMMPGLDGPATFRLLRADERTREIPVVLLTAKVQVGDRQVWDDLDVAGVISKPFDPMTLATEVSRILGWP
ncbi:response regulator [Nocardioides ferulae]|uniref:response regulator n=1 Tax=Nocardioides ferulae TaxID=2340821 RepID=UPI001F0C10F7|nr:response regulator [Nocardioides ferulae]